MSPNARPLQDRKISSALLLMVCLFLSGCIERSELTWTRKSPKQIDLVGTWVPTTQTVEDMKKRGGYAQADHEVVLGADGTFSMINMPDWWTNDLGDSNGKFESASGKWRLVEDNDVWTVWGIELDFPPNTAHDGIHVRGQKPPYLLQFTLGDPDDGHFMLFERR